MRPRYLDRSQPPDPGPWLPVVVFGVCAIVSTAYGIAHKATKLYRWHVGRKPL